jgi:hypothetical protein
MQQPQGHPQAPCDPTKPCGSSNLEAPGLRLCFPKEEMRRGTTTGAARSKWVPPPGCWDRGLPRGGAAQPNGVWCFRQPKGHSEFSWSSAGSRGGTRESSWTQCTRSHLSSCPGTGNAKIPVSTLKSKRWGLAEHAAAWGTPPGTL